MDYRNSKPTTNTEAKHLSTDSKKAYYSRKEKQNKNIKEEKPRSADKKRLLKEPPIVIKGIVYQGNGKVSIPQIYFTPT